MSHMIEEGKDVVFTPNMEEFSSTWHNKHTVASGDRIEPDGSNVKKAFCPIVEIAMNPQFPDSMELDQEIQDEIANWKLIAADCREGISGKIHPLHVPKDGYQIHQNKLLFDCMVKSAEQVLGSGNFEIATVGTLDGYKQFFMSIAIKGMESFAVGNESDKWKQYFNLISSHNGLVASSFMLAFIRMVCMNTVMASIAQASANGTQSTFRHSKNSLDLITPESFENTLREWVTNSENYRNSLESLRESSMNLDSFRAFSAGVFTEEKSDKISTTSFNRVVELEGLFLDGKGNYGESRYDALNAWTEYFTSGNGAGKQSGAKKIARANFGRGNDWKNEAFRVLTNSEEFDTAMERGERLLNDRALLAKAN